MKIISDNEEKLRAYFEYSPSKTAPHLFQQLMNAHSEILQFSEMNRFIEGFQPGARFMLDALIYPQQSVIRDIC